MLDVAPTELLLIAVVALVVIGPKDLPKVMRTVGHWVGRARGVARHFRTGIDTMIREAELEEMEKKWKAENDRIMRDYPAVSSDPAASALPPPAEPQTETQPMLPLPTANEGAAPSAPEADGPRGPS